MYESFFEFGARPFLAAPLAERYFPAASMEHARATVARCVERAEGPAIVIGSAGTGKSMLCHVLGEQLRERFPVAMLASARLCTRRALLQNILFELKLPYRDREEGELRLALIDFLQPSEDCPDGILLLVDEAHMLPLRLLEEIRMITNLVRDGQPRVRLVLAASLIFDERLASPRLESFNQRIAARCYLQSMSRDETQAYIRAQIAAVGGNPDRILTDDAMHAVFRATDGIPRLVNQVCDHALVLAAVGKCERIEASGIEEAWADLQQLPTPWNVTSSEASAPQTDILEFGALDDELCGELDAVPTDAESCVPDQSTPLEEVTEEAVAFSDNLEQAPPPENGGIDQHAADIADQDLSQFRPAAEKGPEIELVFHHAHDPFGERFEEEEVIVDPYVSLEKLNSSHTSIRENSDARETIELSDHRPSVERQEAASEATVEVPRSEAAEWPVNTELDQEPVAMPLSSDTAENQWLPNDDRDLLDIFDDAKQLVAQSADAAAPRPKRRQYRQLFATLRRR